MAKIDKFGGNFTKSWPKQLCTFETGYGNYLSIIQWAVKLSWLESALHAHCWLSLWDGDQQIDLFSGVQSWFICKFMHARLGSYESQWAVVTIVVVLVDIQTDTDRQRYSIWSSMNSWTEILHYYNIVDSDGWVMCSDVCLWCVCWITMIDMVDLAWNCPPIMTTLLQSFRYSCLTRCSACIMSRPVND